MLGVGLASLAAATAFAAVPPPLARVSAANRSATQEPASQGFVNAVQIYPFADGAIFQAYTAPGVITDLSLQPGESLVAVASGDTARWVIGDTTSGSGEGKRTHILVKPFSAGLETNLVITTDRRSYHVRLRSTSHVAMMALSWIYPQDVMIALQKAKVAAEQAAPIAAGLNIDQLHFNYRIDGDKADWRPLRAFDDGRQTFIEFPPSLSTGDAPPLFVLGADKKAELVNYRQRGRFYVVDRLFDVAELRLGTKKQQIVRISRIGDPHSARSAA
ncbi:MULTISPECIES: P-type conjugative transfer protein TrbG [unclassified Sphingomonas]|uniref:P-type conjugative transfer protein TrbG n=1 Tax=unclassified Sphingomonas TaxID=196159 RepID=UPI001F3AD42D|nr:MULTISPECIES: P-type conjugative transfer protein TrbG [unclassified Sphingomonas]